MIWSDSTSPPSFSLAALTKRIVLFCLPAKNNALSGYYDPDSVVSAELSQSIPDECEMVFWEYVPCYPSAGPR